MAMDLKGICDKYRNDAGLLMDILRDVQTEYRCISDDAVAQIADSVGLSTVDVEQTVTFYHFYTKENAGKYSVYLNESAVAEMNGRSAVAEAFERAAGCSFGSISECGKIGLYNTACIGMNDQEPAALINGFVFTKLTPDKVASIVAELRAGKSLCDLVTEYGDGANSNDQIKAMVNNNIQKKGAVILGDYEKGAALAKCVKLDPVSVINEVKKSNIRGRGGAGFPTGMKWDFCSKAVDKERYIVCNADEGEPGTFKDRVILTEKPELVFEGMAIAGYAVSASQGIVYLRGEYIYLLNHLENVLAQMRSNNLLGKNIAGKNGFDFDIKIQMGAGAYVCGEESALLESAEGRRGEPRIRPPFPVECGYLNKPTSINNVETYCCAARIIEKGADWFKGFGNTNSTGTKLLSVSGDCAKPGVYEVEWGLTIGELLDMVGADTPKAVQVGGPSGNCIGPKEYGRKICFNDLATGGSIIVIGKERNLLEIVQNFVNFFVDESCGSCAPCRAGNAIVSNLLDKIVSGNGVAADLDTLLSLGKTMKTTNRCGLGQTSANPVVTTIQNLREEYEAVLKEDSPYTHGFDIESAVADSCEYVGRTPNL